MTGRTEIYHRQNSSAAYETKKVKAALYSITERRIPELIPVLGSQPAGERVKNSAVGCHYFPPGLQLSSQPWQGCYQFCCLERHNGCEQFACPKTVTQQRRGCDLNPGPSAPQSSTLTTRLPSHQPMRLCGLKFGKDFSFSFSLSLVKLSLFLWSFPTSTSNCVLIKCNKWNKVNIIKTAWMQSASTRKPETKLYHKNNKHRIKTSRC